MRLAFLLVLVACGGDVPKGPDAANFCMGSAYDPCLDEHNCPNTPAAICMPIGPNHVAVCTVACSATAPCPADSTGTVGTCNANSVCETTAIPDCTPNPL
jgi:hypothetical protein